MEKKSELEIAAGYKLRQKGDHMRDMIKNDTDSANETVNTSVSSKKSEDKNNAIQKLAEHRDIKLMVKEIGEKYGIDIQSTEGNSHLGDFSYPKEDEQKLIAILDRYLKDQRR